ncbi:hypothetical protein ZIOFF_053099 [Zingiber officinale]|uniref:Uncharacterized protein n=1 Tax=Zingiber officinale TaxID=94328 RepID=A0A8J5KMS9_ZINOF|nr:hypothetical protein ZIOFF_053099 [Zingiber officinale]
MHDRSDAAALPDVGGKRPVVLVELTTNEKNRDALIHVDGSAPVSAGEGVHIAVAVPSAKESGEKYQSGDFPRIRVEVECKRTAATEACKSFEESQEENTKEFEERKIELEAKALEIYQASDADIKFIFILLESIIADYFNKLGWFINPYEVIHLMEFETREGKGKKS